MAALPNFRGQTNLIDRFNFDGSIASATAPQLILPKTEGRSSFSFQNTSSAVMWLQMGPATAKATVTSGVVTSIAVVNGGFGYSYAPRIKILGGGQRTGNGLDLGSGMPGSPSPSNYATAHCVMTGTAPNMSIASIVVDNGGAGYSNNVLSAPYVLLLNDPNDLFGCASPYGGGSGSGYQIAAGASFYEAYSIVSTEAVSVFCATAAATFVCRTTQ